MPKLKRLRAENQAIQDRIVRLREAADELSRRQRLQKQEAERSLRYALLDAEMVFYRNGFDHKGPMVDLVRAKTAAMWDATLKMKEQAELLALKDKDVNAAYDKVREAERERIKFLRTEVLAAVTGLVELGRMRGIAESSGGVTAEGAHFRSEEADVAYKVGIAENLETILFALEMSSMGDTP